MLKKFIVAMLASCLVVAAHAAIGYDDVLGESAYLSGAIGQPLL